MSSMDSSIPPVIEPPRSPLPAIARGRTNTELYAWLFMRVSGVVLVVLVLGHLFIMNILDGGVQRINLGLRGRPMGVAVLAGVGPAHALAGRCCTATNGMRTIINDYTRRDGDPVLAQGAAVHRHHRRDRAGHAGDLHLRSEHL